MNRNINHLLTYKEALSKIADTQPTKIYIKMSKLVLLDKTCLIRHKTCLIIRIRQRITLKTLLSKISNTFGFNNLRQKASVPTQFCLKIISNQVLHTHQKTHKPKPPKQKHYNHAYVTF